MRRLLLILVALGLTFLLMQPIRVSSVTVRVEEATATPSQLPTFVVATRNYSVKIESTRVVSINEWLYVSLSERINVTNLDERPFNAFIMYWPVPAWRKLMLVNITAEWLNRTFVLPYRVLYQAGPYLAIAVGLPTFLPQNESIIVNIDGYIPRENLRVFFSNDCYYELQFARTSLFPYEQKRKSIFTAPTTARFVESLLQKRGLKYSVEGTKLKFEDEKFQPPFNESEPLNKTIVPIRFTLRIVPLRLVSVTREIEVTLTNALRVRETYVIAGLFPWHKPAEERWKTERVTVSLLPNAQNITARDDLGTLRTSTRKESRAGTLVEVTLRTPITGPVTYEFMITYNVRAEAPMLNVTEVGWMQRIVELRLPVAPAINATISSYRLVLKLPSYLAVHVERGNVEISQATVTDALGFSERKLLVITLTDVLPWKNPRLVLVFDVYWPSIAAYLLKIFAIVLLLFALILLAIRAVARRVAVRVPPAEEVRLSEVREALRRYILACEEYLALDTLVDETLRRHVSSRTVAPAIVDRIRGYLDELRRRREALYRLGDRLKSEPELGEYVARIEEADAAIEVARELLIRDWTRYLQGEIDWETFINRASALVSEIDRLRDQRDRAYGALKDLLVLKYGG